MPAPGKATGVLRAPLLAALGLTAACDGGGGPWLTAPSSSTHDVYFPIRAGAHAVDCNTCHGGYDTFTEFDCLTCHVQADMDPAHAGLGADYGYASPTCYSCHLDGTVDPTFHDPYFPIRSGHSGIPCSTCHVDPADRTNFSCLEGNCHPRSATDKHHGEVGSRYAYDSQHCYSCHRNGTGDD